MGIFAGQYGGATLVSGYMSVSFNSQLALEGALGQYPRQVLQRRDRRYRFCARAHAGDGAGRPSSRSALGLVRVEPKATLVQAPDRTEQTAYVGGGIRYYLTRRFFLRAEYKAHYVFTKRNENEDADEWKLGFAFFF